MMVNKHSMPERPHITIYPHGTRQTDYEELKWLSMKSQPALDAAQKLIVAADNFINRKGWFTKDKTRAERLVAAYENFTLSLKIAHFMQNEDPEYAAIKYLDLLSSACPNWQEEYFFLNDFIWRAKRIEESGTIPLNL